MQSSFRSPFIVALSGVERRAKLWLDCGVASKCVTESGTELTYRHIALVVFVHKSRQVVNVVLGQHLQAIDGKFKGAQVYKFSLFGVKLLQKALRLSLHHLKFGSHIDQTLSSFNAITYLFKFGSQQFNESLFCYLLWSVLILKVFFNSAHFFLVQRNSVITIERVSQFFCRQSLVFIFIVLVE